MDNIRIHLIVDIDENSSDFSPSFGVGYLSSYLKTKRPGTQITLSLLSDNIFSDIRDIKPDIVGIGCTSRYFSQLKALAKEIKENFHVPLIWGGVHISIAPHELPEFCDLGVIGEGEETLLELLDHFDNGEFRGLESIKGIAYWRDGRMVISAPRPFIDPIDQIPPPDLDLLRVKWSRFHRGVMITSRGCPYKCRFCASSLFWHRARLHSPQHVAEEMRTIIRRYNAREILIYDDFFPINEKRIAEIRGLIENDPAFRKVRFECLSRVDTFNESVARQLKEMGVYRISFGIESGCQNTLDYLKNRSIKTEQAEKAIRTAKRYGFECVGSFIIGAPYENREEIEETLSFIEKLDLDSVQITIATPFPGTGLWEDGKKIGKIEGNTWRDEYYALFSNNPHQDPLELIRDKILLTQVDDESFRRLLKRASALANKINHSPLKKLRMIRDTLKRDPRALFYVLKRRIDGSAKSWKH